MSQPVEDWVIQIAEQAYRIYSRVYEETLCLPHGNTRNWDLLDIGERAGWIAATAAIAYQCLQKDGADAAIASVIAEGKEEFEKVIAR